MQSKNPIFEEFAKMMEGAFSVAQTAGEEARTLFKSQCDRFVAQLDLVYREEFEALRNHFTTEIAGLKQEIAEIKKPGAKGAKPQKHSEDIGAAKKE